MSKPGISWTDFKFQTVEKTSEQLENVILNPSNSLSQTEKAKGEEGQLKHQNRGPDINKSRRGRPTQRKRYTRRTPNSQQFDRKKAQNRVVGKPEERIALSSGGVGSDVVSRESMLTTKPPIPLIANPKPEAGSENLIDRITGFFGKNSKRVDSSSGADS